MKNLTETRICAFEESLRENEKAEATIQKYGAILRKLMDYLNGAEITKIRLMAYRDQMREDHAPQTVNGAISAINAYLDFYHLEDYKMKLLKVQRRLFRPSEKEMSRREFNALVATANRLGRKQLALLMETICSTGIRVSEVAYITVEAAKLGRAEISLKGKIRTILLPKKLCRKLLKYAKKQRIFYGELFLTRNGVSLSRKQIWAEMKTLCKEAGVEETKVFPHNLRHLFARCYYKSTHDIAKLADLLGHSSVETTRIYLISTGEEHAKTLERLRLVS